LVIAAKASKAQQGSSAQTTEEVGVAHQPNLEHELFLQMICLMDASFEC
jgi:hypothetical protein